MPNTKIEVRDENYIVIQGWMVNKLNLKGNELLVYAVIYGFSQAKDQYFTGTAQYLADWTNATRRSIMNTLNALVQKGLIEKQDQYENGEKSVYYRAIGYEEFSQGGYEKSSQGYENFSQGDMKNFHRGYEKSSSDTSIYNIDCNTEYNIEESAPKKKKTKTDFIPDWFEEVWKLYPRKEGKTKITIDSYKAISEAGKETIVKAIGNYKRILVEDKVERRYIMHGSTFFNGRWTDYVSVDNEQMTIQPEISTDEHNEEFLRLMGAIP